MVKKLPGLPKVTVDKEYLPSPAELKVLVFTVIGAKGMLIVGECDEHDLTWSAKATTASSSY